jgi:Ankyrin repeats (3 copies)/Ankyrin repeat
MFNKMHISALSTLLLLTSSFTLSMKRQAQEHSIDYFAEIPTELKHYITTLLIEDNSLEQAIEDIRSLSTTNKAFNAVMQDPYLTEFLIKLLATTFKNSEVWCAFKLDTKQSIYWFKTHLKDLTKEEIERLCCDAITKNNIYFLKLVIESGIDICRLKYKAPHKPSYLALACLERNNEIINLLLPFYQDDRDAKSIALHGACQKNYLEIAKTLVESGAQDIYQVYSICGLISTKTGLMHAVINNNKELVKLLLEHGADPLFQDYMDRSAIDFARANNNQDIIDLLSE